MYSTCLHCHAALGANEVIEHFPVGRKLAFDAAKGRLWVVCAKCRRWNLTPIEERWEAIEECERQYRATRLRASTDNIGLARLSEGLEVIRIGQPEKPEIASWRYTASIRRRWLTRGLPIAATTAVGAPLLMVLGNPGLLHSFGLGLTAAIVAAIGGNIAVGAISGQVMELGERARVAMPDGTIGTLRRDDLKSIRLVPTENGWGLSGAFDSEEVGTGLNAIHTLRAVTTARNFRGARPPEVASALDVLARAGDAERFIVKLARASSRTGIDRYPPDIAFALEMAIHDESERRAMEGELRELELEWQLADEIAQIADDLLLPAGTLERLDALRHGSAAGSPPAMS